MTATSAFIPGAICPRSVKPKINAGKPLAERTACSSVSTWRSRAYHARRRVKLPKQRGRRFAFQELGED